MAKSGMSDVESDEEDNKNSQKSTEPEMNVQCPSNNPGNAICAPIKPSTPVSILIESLVKNLCSIYEPDDDQANKIYNLVCNKLFEMKLIDESYNMTEFEGMRNQYQRALYRLVSTAIGGKQPPQPSLQSFWHNNDIISDWSHYHREFEEVEYIAGGGFGQVNPLRSFI